MQIPRQLELPKRVVQQTIDDEAPELAAGLAYRFLFALFPFAIFVSALAAFVSQAVGMGDPTDEILGAVGDNLPPDVASQIAPQLQQVLGETRPGLLSFGALLALWAATSAISSLMGAMNKAYDVDETRNFFVKNGLAILLTLIGSVGVIFAFVTMVGGSVASEQVVEQLGISDGVWSTISLIRFPIVLVVVAIAVAVLFRYGPNVAVSFRWTLVGGLRVRRRLGVRRRCCSASTSRTSRNYANTYGALGGVDRADAVVLHHCAAAAGRGRGRVRPREGARAREGRCPASRDGAARRGAGRQACRSGSRRRSRGHASRDPARIWPSDRAPAHARPET